MREVSLSKLLPIEREAKTRLSESLPSLRIREALAPERTLDYAQQERSDTLAIGSEVAYYAGSRHLLNLASDEGMYGYDGLIRLMRGLRESAAEEAYEKSSCHVLTAFCGRLFGGVFGALPARGYDLYPRCLRLHGKLRAL